MDRVNKLLEQATAQAGLDEFGEESFREGLEVLVGALDREAHLTEFGRVAIESQLVETLVQRLKIEDWYRRHPEIDDQEIISPLIGLGLPRTGSTAFSCMLAEDPSIRYLRSWEVLMPVPPPEKAIEDVDPRIEASWKSMEAQDRLAPRFKTMLPASPTTPTECHNFMAYDFKSHAYPAYMHIPSYLDWLVHQADMVPTFRYLKRVLKLLQWHCPPNRWRLKNPSHILFIDALNQVFPDARFWMTHRDVAKVIPSTSDLHYELTRGLTDHVDKVFLGRKNSEIWQIGMQRLIAFRDAGNDHRFFDAHFAVFQRDPFPTLEALYRFLGEELTDETRARMVVWRSNTPREKYGEHQYDPADFGIDPADLNQKFRFYNERFGVLEAA